MPKKLNVMHSQNQKSLMFILYEKVGRKGLYNLKSRDSHKVLFK